jgi:glycine cleavage system H protein
VKVESCEFPDDLLFDEDGLVWVRRDVSGDLVLGASAIYVALTGRLSSVRSKELGREYEKNQAVALLESPKYFGPLRTPVSGTLIAANSKAFADPKLVTDSPYADGWIVRLRPVRWEEERTRLRNAGGSKDRLAAQIAALRVHCYAAFPDHEMFEIGTECAAVLTRLDELIAEIKPGEVVHIVSDDWTAPAEMANWSMRTNQPVIDEHKEGNLYHFLIRKSVVP